MEILHLLSVKVNIEFVNLIWKKILGVAVF